MERPTVTVVGGGWRFDDTSLAASMTQMKGKKRPKVDQDR